MEAIMARRNAQLILGAAVVAGMSVVAATTMGRAVAQSPVADTRVMMEKAIADDGDFQFGDHQRLKSYLLDGPRNRSK
jgi:hypothetical protein